MDALTLEAQGVVHRYRSTGEAVRDVSFTIKSGTTALVGVNGAGKTTLLSVLSGALRPTAGTARICGVDLYGRGRRRVLPRVALMPQQLSLPGNLTALEAVSVIGWMRGLSGPALRRRARQALTAVDLEPYAGRQVRQLSGGMRRRVALAQALCTEPDVLVLDEPSTGLDPEQRRHMVELVQSLQATVLFSSHVLEDVVDVADRVIVLHAGRVRFEGSVAALQARAPEGTPAARQAEAGFLSVITAAGDGT